MIINLYFFSIFAIEMEKKYQLLNKIQFPADLKKLTPSQLPQLCEELRDFIIAKTAENPGHLGSSLGTVELTVALHYVFNTPTDKLVWDVGHQAYCHKIITGRKDMFETNRQFGGICGFPRMDESEYDSFGTGHSSTSISAILGMAIADKLSGNNKDNHIAVIGDGAIGGGMAFEAMNHAGAGNANVLIVLNDNKIAIDKNVGAMSRYLLNITTSPSYNRFKNRLWNLFTFHKNESNKFINFLSKTGNVLKGYMLRGSNLFQSLGFRYFGPANGHDVLYLVKLLQQLKGIPGPKLLHVITIKGRGLSLAEKDQTTYHAPGKFDPDTGELIKAEHPNNSIKYQDIFGNTILTLAKRNPKVIGITPAMLTGSSLSIMQKVFPERVFDVGIAEQHAVTFAAGLATKGYIPFCNIYSSFLQRGYDQIIHDVALQELPVIFCIDRGGLVGEDGATHQGIFDLAFLRAIPNMIIASPFNEDALENLLYTAYLNQKHPFAIRYPRGNGVLGQTRQTEFKALPIGKANLLHSGKEIAILSLGPIGNHVTEAISLLNKQGINPTHIDIQFLKPLDEDLLHILVKEHPLLITIEDGTVKGGLFSAVSEFLILHQYPNQIKPIAIPDLFVEHGDLPNLYRKFGFDAQGIADFIIRQHQS